MRLNAYTIKAIEREIENLEQTKKEFPNDEWMYEPDLSQLKQQLEEVKSYV
jgi:alpha-acetolactate decarboxylase